jgi:hypothetical protein
VHNRVEDWVLDHVGLTYLLLNLSCWLAALAVLALCNLIR